MGSRTLIVLGGRPDPEDGAAGRPRRDYEALIQRLDADVLHPGALLGGTRRLGTGIAMARLASGRADAYDNIYCDSEHIGFPLAYLLARRGQRPRLTLIAHLLSPLKKRLTVRALRLQHKIDAIALHSPAQAALAEKLGFPAPVIRLMPYQVDTDFWRPQPAAESTLIASAGQEFRDYGTLLRAVDGMPAEVRIARGSNWSTRGTNFTDADVPSNAVIRWHNYAELRDLYARSRCVVVPLHDVDFQAGISTVLEAMAMGKCVIVTRTAGLTGVVSGRLMRDGVLHDIGEQSWGEPTGIYVPPRDANALRDAITYILDHPDEAAQMGAAARRHVEQEFTLPQFAGRIASVITGTEATGIPDTAMRAS